MPYVTVKQSPRYHQMTLDEVLSGSVSMDKFIQHDETGTRTRFAGYLNPVMLERYDFAGMMDAFRAFAEQHSALYEVERSTLYTSFHIPKKSGGLRPIDAPLEPLKVALLQLRMILETQMYASYHTSAFAYIKNRCPVNALKRHQANGSKWFLKIDFSNFFGSTSPAFLQSQLQTIFPFSQIMQSPYGLDCLMKAMDLCFLNGGLPQGTPISPMLTNLIMIPIDHALYNQFRDFDGQYIVYTRYADDILLSCRHEFDPKKTESFITKTLLEFTAPYKIKPEKTRYGSSAGSNWNLGLILNKDNEISLGYRRKKQFKAMVNNYLCNRRDHILWSKEDLQIMHGHISYYLMIERAYIQHILDNFKIKFGVDVKASILQDLKSV